MPLRTASYNQAETRNFPWDSSLSYLPKVKISYNNWPYLAGLDLADPDYADPSKVDCILGAGIYSNIIWNGLINGPTASPVVQQSVLDCF